MTNEQAGPAGWSVQDTEGRPERPQAMLSGDGATFILYRREDALALADLLNAQTQALAEAAALGRRYDCGKTNLQKAAMVPCLNLPRAEDCYACRIARARYERNSFCICSDDDEFPTTPADYCPVHGNTYRYVLQEEARLVDVVRARAAANERAEAAEARAAQLESALRSISKSETKAVAELRAMAQAALDGDQPQQSPGV